MAILKLKPACKDYLWGGHKIREKYHIESDAEPFAEAWILSANEKGPSIIENGEYAGMSFREYCENHPEAVGLNPVITGEFRGVSGESGVTTERFPVLIKFLDAYKSLSLQVHPDDNTAHLLNRDTGKTEFIYILEAEEGAELIYGLEKEISFREWRERVYTRKVLDVGTVRILHGKGTGALREEIQKYVRTVPGVVSAADEHIQFGGSGVTVVKFG
ncbi:MAG: Smr/MutS family protein [Erysipelotrichales bacterium]|nr:Smr/MutS family protein [Erysipelotrichales bacterium]